MDRADRSKVFINASQTYSTFTNETILNMVSEQAKLLGSNLIITNLMKMCTCWAMMGKIIPPIHEGSC